SARRQGDRRCAAVARRAVQRSARADPRPQAQSLEVLLEGVMLAQDSRLARRVGAIALGVMATITAGFVFLLDQPALGAAIRIRVLFRHTAGLREQAALVVAGQRVGKVEAITPVLHGAPGPLAGEVGVAGPGAGR